MADWGYGHYSPSPQDCVSHADWTYEPQVPPRYRQFQHYAHTSFDLPRFSSLLYFVSRGVLSHGSIEIVNDGTNPDQVTVEVDLLYNFDDVLDRVDVCTLQRDEDQNGVGIFVSHCRCCRYSLYLPGYLSFVRVRSIILILIIRKELSSW